MRMIPDHVLVITDETYHEFSIDLDPIFPNSLALENDNLLTLRTFSKAYGIARVRIRYAIGHPKIIEALNKVRLTFEPSTLAQAAGIGALQDENFLEKTVRNNTTGMKYLTAQFDRQGIPYIPSYGNFVMTVWNSSQQAKGITQKLMNRDVLVRGLQGNLEHCILITIGRTDEPKWLVTNLELL